MGLVITVSATFNIHRVVLLLGATETIAPLCRSLCPLYFHCSTLYDLLFYYEQPAAFPGKSFFCHGWHYSRRSFKYCTGSAVYLYSGHGNCRCCFSYRTFPVYQFLYPFMDVQSSGQLHFHQHPQIPPETGDLSRGPLWSIPSLGRQGIASVATILMNFMCQPYGDAAIAAMSIVSRFMFFINSVIIGFGQGFQPVCSYCFGAGLTTA